MGFLNIKPAPPTLQVDCVEVSGRGWLARHSGETHKRADVYIMMYTEQDKANGDLAFDVTYQQLLCSLHIERYLAKFYVEIKLYDDLYY